MIQVKGMSLNIFLLLFCLAGCASMHVQVDKETTWQEVSTVALQPPPEDPWLLEAPIRKELEEMGLTILPENGSRPDLDVRFFVKQAPDLNEDGEVLDRLVSLHVQFVEPGSAIYVAVADYFYAEGLNRPETGVRVAFAQLRQEIENTGAAETAPGPTGSTPAAPAPQRSAEQKSTPQNHDAVPLPSSTNQDHELQKESREIQSTPHSAEPEVPLEDDRAPHNTIKPKTKSPWIPKLKSWGIEEWGKENADDFS